MPELRAKNLVVLASTFPRWKDDTVPSFVLRFAQEVRPRVRSVTAVVPHFAGAKRAETLPDGIRVRRFRYAWPYKYEDLTYGQEAKKTLMYKVRGLLYVVSELGTTLWTCLWRRPVIINAHWTVPQGFVAVLLAPLLRARVVITVHGQDVFTMNGKRMRQIKRFILRRADVVVANSSATQKICKELWPGQDYPIIPMGIDVERFKLATHKGQSAGTYEILYVGRLAPIKGVAYLCEAVYLLHQRHTNVHLSIIGDGPDRPAIEAFIREHGLSDAVTLAGWVQPADLPARYHASDVFVGPPIEVEAGRKEALGLVFAEASACGLPVITTDAGGMVDIVKDGETGFIVPQKDAQAICDKLAYLYAHREEGRAMGVRGSTFVRERFSWESIAERYAAILQG